MMCAVEVERRRPIRPCLAKQEADVKSTLARWTRCLVRDYKIDGRQIMHSDKMKPRCRRESVGRGVSMRCGAM